MAATAATNNLFDLRQRTPFMSSELLDQMQCLGVLLIVDVVTPVRSASLQSTILGPQVTPFISMGEVNSFRTEFNDIFRTTHIPQMPAMFLHFCIPFSPICLMSYYSQKRERKVKAAVEEWNAKLVPRGAHIEIGSHVGVVILYLVRHEVTSEPNNAFPVRNTQAVELIESPDKLSPRANYIPMAKVIPITAQAMDDRDDVDVAASSGGQYERVHVERVYEPSH